MKIYCMNCVRRLDKVIKRGQVTDTIFAECEDCGFMVRIDC